MVHDWLVARLTPVKWATLRWFDLARALQDFWETLFDPAFQRMRDLSSIYTADEAGRRLIVAELGDYFDPDQTDASVPMSVATRKLELAMKETDYPIINAIQRIGLEEGSILTIGAKWLPLWALESDGDYGTKFYHEQTGIPDGAYLTSRGIIYADLADISQDSLDKVNELVKKVKPLHICYDGMIYANIDHAGSFNLISMLREPIVTQTNDRIVTQGA